MKNVINIKIALDTRQKKEKAPLKLVVSRGSSSAMIDLGYSVAPENWDRKERKVLGPQAQSLNDTLEEKKLKARKIKDRLQEDGELEGRTIAQIKDLIADRLFPERGVTVGKKGANFMAHFQKFMDRKSGGTYSVYNQTKAKLEKYKDDIGELTFEEITTQWLKDFESWLAAAEIKRNARNIHLRNIRAIFNDALDEEIISCYPFRRFKIKAEETRKRSLGIDDLRKLFTMEVEPYAEIYRDMFKLIFMLIGINAVDLYGLERIGKDGRVEFQRAKTHRLYSIKVEPEAMEIIDRWRGEKGLLSIRDRWTDHRNFLHQMNKALARIGSPIETPQGKKGEGMFPGLSTYWARHTWATIAAELDVPDAIIALALGHATAHRTTEIYIDRNLKKVDEANRKVLDWVLYRKRDLGTGTGLSDSSKNLTSVDAGQVCINFTNTSFFEYAVTSPTPSSRDDIQ